MGYKATVRAMEAASTAAAARRAKTSARIGASNKEQIKRSAIEQARLEVETHENKLEVLLSVPQAAGEIWDWVALASSVAAHRVRKKNSRSRNSKRKQLMLVFDFAAKGVCH